MTGRASPRLSAHLRAGVAALTVVSQLAAGPAAAFCGFYVAKADSRLFNRSSRVVLSRDGDHTAVTMASDYAGDPREFAVVIPVPTFIARRQIGVVDPGTVDRLDAFTAPRLVEYHDPDPCQEGLYATRPAAAPDARPYRSSVMRRGAGSGVTVEASYDVGEYDVSILSARDSDGLAGWLTANGYRIPAGAGAVLGSYIRQGMRFFVAKVDLDRMKLAGNGFLRPLQVRYDTRKFMLPLRLGTVNADGPQDLVVYALTRNGRVEAANYRTVKVPSGDEVPLYVSEDFGSFYKAVFDRAVAREDMGAVFVEYAWDMGWCDPCAADPLSNHQLVTLGARWIGDDNDAPFTGGEARAFVTRLHVRYDAQSFPEDIVFQETLDDDNFQGRYVLNHPWQGPARCPAGRSYRDGLRMRLRREAGNLVALTGWPRSEVEARMASSPELVGAAPWP